MKDKTLSKYFLLILVVLASVATVWLFRPFLVELLISAVLVTAFYKPFSKLSKFLGGRREISAFLMCLFLLIIVIVPIVFLLSFLGKKAPLAYNETINFVNNYNVQDGFLSKLGFINLENETVKQTIIDSTKKISDWISIGVKEVLKQTGKFVISLFLILIACYFFFIDGHKFLAKLKLWSPLPDKYDLEIYQKFKDMSFVSMISTFATAAVQGVVGGLGFWIVGLPAFYPGLLIGFFSLIPYVGSMVIYIPIGIFLILSSDISRGVYVLLWGAIVIGNIDNLLRAWILKGKSKTNPVLIIFSLMGGITLFGFWGLVLGPLFLALAATVFYIYELEYKKSLEKFK